MTCPRLALFAALLAAGCYRSHAPLDGDVPLVCAADTDEARPPLTGCATFEVSARTGALALPFDCPDLARLGSDRFSSALLLRAPEDGTYSIRVTSDAEFEGYAVARSPDPNTCGSCQGYRTGAAVIRDRFGLAMAEDLGPAPTWFLFAPHDGAITVEACSRRR